MAANNIYIQVDLNSQSAQQNVNALNQAIASTGPEAEKSSKKTTQALTGVQLQVKQTISAFGELTTAIAGLGIARAVQSMLQSSAEFSRAQQAITAFAGSAEDARKVIEQVQQIARQSPFHFSELQQSARELLGYGIAAKDVTRDLKAITDQVTAMGGSMEDVTAITRIFGRIMETDIVSAMALIRKLPAEGVPVMKAFRDELSKALRRPVDDKDVQEAMKQGLLDPTQTIRVLTEAMGKVKVPADQAMTAFKNIFDAMKKARDEFFSDQGFGKAFTQLARDIETVLRPLGQFVKLLESMPDEVKVWIVRLAALGAGATALAGGFAVLTTVFGPLVAAMAGVIALLPEILTVMGALAGIGAILYKAVPGVKQWADGIKSDIDGLKAKAEEMQKALGKAFTAPSADEEDIRKKEAVEAKLQELMRETRATADAGRRALFEAFSSPVEAVALKYDDLFAKLREKLGLFTDEEQKKVLDVLRGGEAAELAGARFKEEKRVSDELAKYNVDKVKGSYDAQIAYIEALDEQGAQKRVAAIDKITELRIASVQKVAAVEDEHLSDIYQKQAKLLEDPALGLTSTQILDAETNLYNELTARRRDIDEKAFDESQKYRLEGWKKANDVIIEDQKRVFGEFQNLFDQLFDAFTGKSKNIGKAVADVLKKELMGEARNIFSTVLAQGATAAAGYGTPEADFRRTGGVISAILMRGGAPRPPLPPPELWNPTRTESGVKFPDSSGQGTANRLMASADTYHGATEVFAKAVQVFAQSAGEHQDDGKGYAERRMPSADDFAKEFDTASQQTGVSGALLRAMAQTESNFNAGAIGPKTRFGQALGMMQMLPGTAAEFGVTDPFNAGQSIMGGAKYMAQLLGKYHGDVGAALAAYNMGPNAYNRAMARGQALPAETQAYVRNIQALIAQPRIGGPPPGVAASPLAALGTTAVAGPAALPAATLGTAAAAAAYTGYQGTVADINLPFQQKGFVMPSELPATTGLDIMGLPAQSRNNLQALAALAPIFKAGGATGSAVKNLTDWAKNLRQGFGIGTAHQVIGPPGPGGTMGGTYGTTFGSVMNSPMAKAGAGMVGGMLFQAGVFGNAQGTALGLGESTLGGAGLGFSMGGPLGAAIGAAAGFGIGLGEMLAGVESPRNKAKRLATQLYHININNATADKIVEVANSSFGGNVGIAVRSPEVRQMLGVYAAGTGQAGRFSPGLGQAHGASLIESGGQLFQQPTYEYGNPYSYGSNLPVYGGQPTHVLGAPGGGVNLSLNIAGQDAAKFLTGNVVSPDVVQTQYAAAMNNSNGRVAQALMMTSPGAIVGTVSG